MNEADFEQILGYRFRDRELLVRALTHSSYCREKDLPHTRCNERLEFLGDAFLDAVAGEELYRRLERNDEGQLTKKRALVVCERSLAVVGKRLDIGSYLNLGVGEEHTGGRRRTSVTADAVEAVIGAIYLDGGYEAVKAFILREFRGLIDEALAGKLFPDYKTQVQEILQRGGNMPKICYELDRTEGPDHEKMFFVHLSVNGEPCGRGSGRSKKEAEQDAARHSLEGGLLEHVF